MRSPRPWDARFWRRLSSRAFSLASSRAGAHLAKRLTELSQQYQCPEVRGRGLLLALNLQSEIGPQVVGLALQRGLLINAPRTNVLRFMPALTVTRQEIDRMIAILGEVLKELLS